MTEQRKGKYAPVLITGCGCSGTTYLHKLLRKNKISSSHDFGYGEDIIVSNACVGDEVWIYKYNHMGIKEYVETKIPINEFETIIHITRNPLDVISCVISKWNKWGGIWKHVSDTISQLNDPKDITTKKAMIYWLHWNRMIQEKATARFQFEELLTNPVPLFDEIGFEYHKKYTAVAGSSGKKKKLNIDNLMSEDVKLTNNICKMAKKYKYTLK